MLQLLADAKGAEVRRALAFNGATLADVVADLAGRGTDLNAPRKSSWSTPSQRMATA